MNPITVIAAQPLVLWVIDRLRPVRLQAASSVVIGIGFWGFEHLGETALWTSCLVSCVASAAIVIALSSKIKSRRDAIAKSGAAAHAEAT